MSQLLALRELRAGGNQLTSLAGVEGLARLELLDASDNRLEALPCLSGGCLAGGWPVK